MCSASDHFPRIARKEKTYSIFHLLQHMCFPVDIAKLLRTVFFYKTPTVAICEA